MKRRVVLYSIPFCMVMTVMFYQSSVYRYTQFGSEDKQMSDTNLKFQRSVSSCKLFLASFNTTFPFVIFDEKVIYQIENDDCENIPDGKMKVTHYSQIGVDLKYLEDRSILADARFEVIFFSNDTKTDFLDLRTEKRRIIPKFFSQTQNGNIIVPSKSVQFQEMWKRSTYIECLNLYIPREGQSVRLEARKAIESLAKLRNEILSFDIYPFLNGGTLLGWYRECSVIPHTNDLDLMIYSKDLKPELAKHFRSNSSPSQFKLSRQLGKPEDSFELTVKAKTGYKVPIDIFVLYEEKLPNGTIQTWVGGMSGDGSKYKFSYPDYDPWCAGELFGHIFWMTCSPNRMLTFEYGKLWYKDHPSNKFAWNGSGKNVRKNGKWAKEELKDVYLINPK